MTLSAKEAQELLNLATFGPATVETIWRQGEEPKINARYAAPEAVGKPDTWALIDLMAKGLVFRNEREDVPGRSVMVYALTKPGKDEAADLRGRND